MNDFIQYSEIFHHGIKGMHWGIRRYQNPDGSLTEEGKRRQRWASYGDKKNDIETDLNTIRQRQKKEIKDYEKASKTFTAAIREVNEYLKKDPDLWNSLTTDAKYSKAYHKAFDSNPNWKQARKAYGNAGKTIDKTRKEYDDLRQAYYILYGKKVVDKIFDEWYKNLQKSSK